MKVEVKHKRERSMTETNIRPLKTSRTQTGKVVYHLDSDEEEEPIKQKQPRRTLSQPSHADVEVVDLSKG